jgi:uncharacterized repeat protein (TIGR03943 family)
VVAAVTAAGGAISVLVGVVLLRLTLTGTYQRYVREEMAPFLVVAGVAVTVLGLVTLVRALRHDTGPDSRDDHGHEHRHDGDIPIGWLLLAPIAALLLVAPPTLGSYGVDRARVVIRPGDGVFDRLRLGNAPVAMSLLEFGQRAYERNGASFNGVPVQLTGFAAGEDGEAFRLARYQIACCAADATPAIVLVTGTTGDPPLRDQWLTVTGTFERGGGQAPRLSATSVVEISAPADPYE